MFLLRSLSANYYYYLLNLFSKRRPSRSDNVMKETGVFQTYSIAFSRFSNFHREFSNFPIAFCNVFSKINLINNKSVWILASDGTNMYCIFFSQKPESERNKFSHLKIFRGLREVLFSLDLFSLQIRVSDKDRENLHFFFTDRQNWNTLTRFLCQVFFFLLFIQLGEKEFHGSAYFDDSFLAWK